MTSSEENIRIDPCVFFLATLRQYTAQKTHCDSINRGSNRKKPDRCVNSLTAITYTASIMRVFCMMLCKGTNTHRQFMMPVWAVRRRDSCTGSMRDRNSKPLVDRLFGKYLIWTNTISCGLLMAAGDAAAQRIEQYRSVSSGDDEKNVRLPESFDWRRIGIMFVVGLTQGPVQHVFYSWLDQRFVAVNLRNVATKIALDQSIMSPVAIIQFFTAAGILEGQTVAETLAELRAKFLTVFVVSSIILQVFHHTDIYLYLYLHF